MTKYERAKQFYSRATFALSDFLHGRIDELELKKQWQNLENRAIREMN